jgi:hypothetical protein
MRIKSADKSAQSKTQATTMAFAILRQLLECASSLALLKQNERNDSELSLVT